MIRVYRLKDLIKYFILIVIGVVLICIGINLIKNKKVKNKNDTKKVNTDLYLYCLDDSLKENKDYKNDKEDLSKFILSKELLNVEEDNKNNYEKSTKQVANNGNNTNKQSDNSNDNKDENNNTIENQYEDENENSSSANNEENSVDKESLKASTNVKVEAVNNNVKPKVTYTFQGVQINNIAEKELNDDLLNCDNLSINKSKILIYHTHTCESYTPTEENSYTPSGNYRTTDLSHSVVAVGDELESQLKLYDINVIHNKTYHDYPAYNGSYSRSLETIDPILSENKDIDISIDLHRDAIADSSYAPKVKIGDEYVSQMMFVIGTDLGDKRHKDWIENLRFAIKAQKKANELYPGLFKPIILRKSTFNQFESKACCIIEVGATGNTLEESKNAMKYLARVINEM